MLKKNTGNTVGFFQSRKSPKEKTPRRAPVYPLSAERELARAGVEYVEDFIKVLQPTVNSMMRGYVDPDIRHDDAGDFITGVRGKKFTAAERISKRTGAMRTLMRNVSESGELAEELSISDWYEQVNDTIGVQINRDYYKDNMQQMVNEWVHQNVGYIQSLPNEYLGEVEKIIIWGYETHQPKVNVYNRLQKLVGATKSQAKQIARDQLGTLNAQMTRFEHESAGIKKYKWKTRRDSLVRDCHRALNGQVFYYTNPPSMWYVTKSRGIVYTGRRCNPGEDYGCRCVAIPVFDIDEAKSALQAKFLPL